MNEQLIVQRKMEAKKAYSDFIQDCFTMERYGVSYECYMNNVLEQIIALQDDKCNGCDMTDSSTANQITPVDNNTLVRLGNQESVIGHELYDDYDAPQKQVTDINDPHRTKSYIAFQSTDFKFIGPDRPTTEISSVHQYLRISKIIRESGLPNYRQARIPIKFDLDIEAWKRHLCDYPDKKLTQYLQYGFPCLFAVLKPLATKPTKIIIRLFNIHWQLRIIWLKKNQKGPY